MILNQKLPGLPEFARSNAGEYKSNSPFPHIVLKDFFDDGILAEIEREFPDLETLPESEIFKNDLEQKFANPNEALFGPETRKLVRFLNTKPFLEFLQILSGIEEPLLGDPYLHGGGLHEIKPGGLLKIHADFNRHPVFDLDRRLNLLIYLNRDWKPEYGGHLELWDRDMTFCVKRIAPLFNNMVVFSTTDTSFHGHPDALSCPADRSRKSVALYYYTCGRPDHEVTPSLPVHSTLFRKRPANEADATAFPADEE